LPALASISGPKLGLARKRDFPRATSGLARPLTKVD
jgi:hypothetical protein